MPKWRAAAREFPNLSSRRDIRPSRNSAGLYGRESSAGCECVPRGPRVKTQGRAAEPATKLRSGKAAGVFPGAERKDLKGNSQRQKGSPEIERILLQSGCGNCREPSRIFQQAHWASARSEEHTSELQSHSDLVCRL